jgi:hypothetical protein
MHQSITHGPNLAGATGSTTPNGIGWLTRISARSNLLTLSPIHAGETL